MRMYSRNIFFIDFYWAARKELFFKYNIVQEQFQHERFLIVGLENSGPKKIKLLYTCKWKVFHAWECYETKIVRCMKAVLSQKKKSCKNIFTT